MEVMANSNNVLRGGLTVKHVDVPEVISHVPFEGGDDMDAEDGEAEDK